MEADDGATTLQQILDKIELCLSSEPPSSFSIDDPPSIPPALLASAIQLVHITATLNTPKER